MIGVAIPAHNEEACLGACLQAVLRAATHPQLAGEPVMVCVVLDACDDGSAAIVREWQTAFALAARCDRLLACDGAASALDAARRRVPDAATRGIRFETRRLPADWPLDDTFDLVVLSELLYYFAEDAIAAMLAGAAANLTPDGELVLCHYLHDFDDRITPTATVHAIADALPGLRRSLHHRDEAFVLDVWRPVAPLQGIQGERA